MHTHTHAHTPCSALMIPCTVQLLEAVARGQDVDDGIRHYALNSVYFLSR